jgi:hypothetical protein
MRRTARCCCEQSSIEVEGEPFLNVVCHCRNCQRRTGSAFGWSAYFHDSNVIGSSGPLQLYAMKNGQTRWFCGACGTTVFWKAPGPFADYTGVAGGCFSEAPLADPTVSAQNETCFGWVSLPTAWSGHG